MHESHRSIYAGQLPVQVAHHFPFFQALYTTTGCEGQLISFAKRAQYEEKGK